MPDAPLQKALNLSVPMPPMPLAVGRADAPSVLETPLSGHRRVTVAIVTPVVLVPREQPRAVLEVPTSVTMFAAVLTRVGELALLILEVIRTRPRDHAVRILAPPLSVGCVETGAILVIPRPLRRYSPLPMLTGPRSRLRAEFFGVFAIPLAFERQYPLPILSTPINESCPCAHFANFNRSGVDVADSGRIPVVFRISSVCSGATPTSRAAFIRLVTMLFWLDC